jgi:Flp pilus assembly protein TadD
MMYRIAGLILTILAGSVGVTAAEEASTPRHVDLVDLGRVDARVAALLIAGGGRGTVDGASVAELVPGGDGGATLRLTVEVDGTTLLENAPSGPAPIAMAAYVLDDADRLRHFLSRGVVLEAAEREAVAAVGLRWLDAVSLDPGIYSIRLLVRHHETGAAFLDRIRVVVGSEATNAPSLLPPLVESEVPGWVTAMSAESDGSTVPAPARVVWRPGEPLPLLVGGFGLPGAHELRARLVDVAGRTFEEPALLPEDDVGSLYRRVTVEAVDVPPGRYRLVIRAPAPDGSGEALAGLQVVVTPGSGGGAWPTATVASAGESVATGEDDLKKREIRAAYRRVLELLAAGESIQARRQLADLERRVAASGSSAALAGLGRIQRDVAGDLARENPVAVRPVLWLHRTMNRYYRVRREAVLGTQSWNTVAAMAEVLAARGDRSERDFATDVMTEQANELALVPAMRAATDLLRRTLQLDPGHGDALMALGASQERQGLMVEAARVFRRAVRAQPDHNEASLRMAVNLARGGQAASARDVYRELIAADAPSWVRTVAAQELAMDRVNSGNPSEAIRVLTEVMASVEANQRLTIQLAYALEAAGETERAAAVLDTIQADLDSGPSPRLRYAEWPALGPRVDHQGLQRRAEEGTAVLAAALGLVGGGAS